MKFYGYLRRVMPGAAADWLMALGFSVLILLVLYCAFEPHAEFNYLTL